MDAELLTSRGQRLCQHEYDQIVWNISTRTGVEREDAEDAAQDAWVTALEKADELAAGGHSPAGFVVSKGRFNGLQSRARRRTRIGGALSLDRLVDDHGDALLPGSPEALFDQVEARMTLEGAVAAALREPLMDAIRFGDGRLRPRGYFSSWARLTDGQVNRIRYLLARGASIAEVAADFGIHKRSVRDIGSRSVRAAPSDPGWTEERIVLAFQSWGRDHGRAPTLADARGNPGLPSQSPCDRRFGTWRRAIEAAGLVPFERGSAEGPRRWGTARVLTALRDFHAEHG